MKKYKIAIIGGGPAGMMAAISSAKELKKPKNVILIEKNEYLGKKLLLTGGGRCNITNLKPTKKFLEKLRKEDKIFLKHSLYALDNEKLLSIFEKKGLEFKEEENGRCFPITDDANSILLILKEYLSELNINILLNNHVTNISKNKNNIFEINKNNENNKNNEINEANNEDSKSRDNNDFIIETNKKTIYAEKVILATGGDSYPQTGSNGEGYNIAANLGHSISQIYPGAIPLKIEDAFLKKLAGISLENISVLYKTKKNNQKITSKGNVLITHFGLSGPAILDISNYISKDYNFSKDKNSEKFSHEEIELEDTYIYLDILPNMTEEELNEKIILDSQNNGKTMVKNYLKYYLRNRFIDFFLNKIGVSGNKTLSNLTKKDKNKIINNIKSFQIKIKSLPEKSAMISCGGVNIDEINSKTMESKLENCKNLFFAGELLESYGPTGGYNLQIAFSTGYLAGTSATK